MFPSSNHSVSCLRIARFAGGVATSSGEVDRLRFKLALGRGLEVVGSGKVWLLSSAMVLRVARLTVCVLGRGIKPLSCCPFLRLWEAAPGH